MGEPGGWEEPGCCGRAGQLVSAVCRGRAGSGRAVVLLLLAAMLVWVSTGSADISYLFTRRMFDWSEAEYTRVTSLVTLLQTAGSLVLLPLLSLWLRVPDPLLGLAASLSALAATVGVVLSRSGTAFSLALCLGLLSPQVSTVIRSTLSKAVAEHDLGKVYTVLGCLENALPLLAAPLLTVLYNSTLDSFPAAVYLAQAGLIAVVVGMFGLLYHLLVPARTAMEDGASVVLIQDQDHESE